MDWGAITVLGATVLIVGLILRYGATSVPLAQTVVAGAVNETQALALTSAGTRQPSFFGYHSSGA